MVVSISSRLGLGLGVKRRSRQGVEAPFRTDRRQESSQSPFPLLTQYRSSNRPPSDLTSQDCSFSDCPHPLREIMTVNLSKNKSQMEEVLHKIIDPSDSTDWALFGYEGASNVLTLEESGSEGLAELSGAFSGGAIQYGLGAVPCPGTTRPKLLLVHWQGQGVPTARLGATATHIQEVKRLFKPHISHYARDEEEIQADVLEDLVRKVTASIQISSQDQTVPTRQAVGSVYQPVQAQAAVDLKAREEFWAQSQKEEKVRQQEEAKRAKEAAAAAEADRKALTNRIKGEAAQLVPKAPSKPVKLGDDGLPQTGADRLREERQNEVKTLCSAEDKSSAVAEGGSDMTEADRLRSERQAELASLIGAGKGNKAAQWQANARATTTNGATQSRKEPIQLPPKHEATPPPPAPTPKAPISAPPAPASNQSNQPPPPAPTHPPTMKSVPPPAPAPTATRAASPPPPAPPSAPIPATPPVAFASAIPPRPPDSDEEKEDEDEWETGDAQAPSSSTTPTSVSHSTATFYSCPSSSIYTRSCEPTRTRAGARL